MRICSFNVENFFQRPRAMNQESWAQGRPVLAAHAELNTLLEQPTYSNVDKVRIVALLDVLGLNRSDTAPMAVLRQVRGRLVRRPQAGGVEVVAAGRGDWVGWVDLTTEPVTAAAIANTARVIRDLNPQVLGVVEAENRVVLKHFTDAQLRTPAPAGPGQDVPNYPHVILIDGNDDRGIDVAVLTPGRLPAGHRPLARRRHRRPGRRVLPGLPRVRDPHPRRAPPGRAGQPPQVQGLRDAGRQQRPPGPSGPAGR